MAGAEGLLLKASLVNFQLTAIGIVIGASAPPRAAPRAAAGSAARTEDGMVTGISAASATTAPREKRGDHFMCQNPLVGGLFVCMSMCLFVRFNPRPEARRSVQAWHR